MEKDEEGSHKGGQKEDVGWRDRPRCRDSPLFEFKGTGTEAVSCGSDETRIMRREIKRRGGSERDETKHEYKRNIRLKTRSIIKTLRVRGQRYMGDGRSTVPNY